MCANADWPRRGLDMRGESLPLTLLLLYLPERSDKRPWILRGDIDLTAQLRPVGNAWRGTAHVSSASGGMKFSERSRTEIIRYGGLKIHQNKSFYAFFMAPWEERELLAEIRSRLSDLPRDPYEVDIAAA